MLLPEGVLIVEHSKHTDLSKLTTTATLKVTAVICLAFSKTHKNTTTKLNQFKPEKPSKRKPRRFFYR